MRQKRQGHNPDLGTAPKASRRRFGRDSGSRTALWGVALCAALWVAGIAPAPAEERTEPIEVEADHAELDDTTGVSIYTGDVVVVQGPARLEADKVTIHAPARTLERLEAEGRPVRYEEEPLEGPAIRGEGREMEYITADEQLILTGEAVVWQGEDRISGARILFWRESGRLVAEGNADSGERVRTYITPREGADR